MSRAYDFILVCIVTIVSIAIHLLAVEIAGPQSPIHEIAADATNLNGAGLADIWFSIWAVWIPLIGIVGIICFAVLREWRRQSVTRSVPAR